MELLSRAVQVPADLSAVVEANDDIYLRYADGREAEFGVIGVVCGESLAPPSGFAK